MLALHVIPLVLQFGIPLALIVWQIRGSNRGIAGWLAKTLLVAGYLVAVHKAGLWTALPWYTGLVLLAVLGAVVLRQVRAVRRLPWWAPRASWISLAGRSALGLFVITVLGLTTMARRPPAETIVNLDFPLRDGVYYVAGGGSMGLVNPHLMTLEDERFRAYRGQSYALDLFKLGRFGFRATGVQPRDPAQYAIFGDRVFAPCRGVTASAGDGLPDMPPPRADRTRLEGNYVLLDCDGVHVLLGHLMRGSVRVAAGDSVTTDTLVGLVGNSGNTSEPHLHVHAQRPAAPGAEPLSGDPLPVRFNGRYLVRNDRITAHRPAE